MSDETYDIEDLLYLMARLREPDTGCPWDLGQDARSLVPYLLEEAYEVADTIERNDHGHLAEELGDLLFQVVFHARLATEQERFGFNDVVHVLVAKLVSRHPHVFPDGTLESRREKDRDISSGEIGEVWENQKRREREEKGHQSLLADIPVAFPALTRAQKVQKRAARAGFDWSDIVGVTEKIREEIGELEAELEQPDHDRLEDEMGDMLFSLVNLSRHLGIDAETSLRRATEKFQRRFSRMESIAGEENGRHDTLTPELLDAYWERAKDEERQ